MDTGNRGVNDPECGAGRLLARQVGSFTPRFLIISAPIRD
jgi:hypothetical protein